MKSKIDQGTDPVSCHGLDPEKMPVHVAVIMDGNGRWAKKKLMNRVRGHEKGADTVRSIVTVCRKLNIKVLTLYAFSTENWGRPRAEVTALMALLKKFVTDERQTLMDKNICLGVIGQKERLPGDVGRAVDETIRLTRNNTAMRLNLALSYGGREEMTRAVKQMAEKVAAGSLCLEDISEETVSRHLYTADIPDPDIVIRTSGEKRLSNFMLWQAGYAELFFTDTLWPDFTDRAFMDIIRDYQKRDRRFGKVQCSSNDGSPQ
ncbi:Undecaprenyl pyrophosphate synthetase [Desulfocicer vacuolatum DSM 3385]|uniref:Isoprenyl transferase n=1 Tax=Desulfocicer vacuolatum DSM 3385 TaxID=1121400 RepID=A0A1W2BU12_9BACT|nr:isoprenyl transferase [Desulfocicer vacuolatum]SMC76216.1 Undecaprenyl pyrophosphate synthetase [Desulfocicer vacuolatum DSM 3385]